MVYHVPIELSHTFWVGIFSSEQNEATEKFPLKLNEARKYRTVNKIDNLFVLGDYNARHTMWKDNKINKHGEILEDYVTSTQDICVAAQVCLPSCQYRVTV